MNVALLSYSRKLLKLPGAPTITLRYQSRPKSELANYVSHLQLCAAHAHLPKAREIHARLLATGLHASPFAVTSLISLYSRCSRPSLALAVFHSSPPPPNLFAWNAALAALASNSLPSHALRLFRQLRQEAGVRPDKFTYPCVIKACADIDAREEVGGVHAELLKIGLDLDAFTSSALIHAYLKFGFAEDAEKVFDGLGERDVVLWNAMVTGFAHMGQFARAVEYFHQMAVEGMAPSKFTVTGILSVFTSTGDLFNGRKIHGFVNKVGYDDDVVVSNALIDFYGKCQVVEDAAIVFKTMVERDVYSWNSMISAFEFSGDHCGALRLFSCMRRNASVYPDAVTIAAVLPACSQVAALRHGKEIHGCMVASRIGGSGNGDVFVDNALVDMYSKCGVADDARLVFDRMPRHDTASWNIMIDGYAAHGRAREALALFERMRAEGCAGPDEVTFLAVLSACSHAGLVGAGREMLERMLPEFGVAPVAEHYACAVDMLGRAGRLDEAREVAEAGPVGEAAAWRAYLAACRARGETERAVDAAERVVGMEPEESGGWVLLSNAYGWAGKFGEVAEVRQAMRRRKVRKAPGCSWVELGSGLHAFVTGDRGHPESEAIYEVLHVLIGRLRESGYVPDFVMHGEGSVSRPASFPATRVAESFLTNF